MFFSSPYFRIRVRRTIRRRRIGLRGPAKEYVQLKKTARAFIHAKLETWSRYYGVAYKRVAIRNSNSRWGSCSQKGNLNFHYRLLQLPEHLADYVIVHELCHLLELNHSKKFWGLVEKAIPDWKERRRTLRTALQSVK